MRRPDSAFNSMKRKRSEQDQQGWHGTEADRDPPKIFAGTPQIERQDNKPGG